MFLDRFLELRVVGNYGTAVTEGHLALIGSKAQHHIAHPFDRHLFRIQPAIGLFDIHHGLAPSGAAPVFEVVSQVFILVTAVPVAPVVAR